MSSSCARWRTRGQPGIQRWPVGLRLLRLAAWGLTVISVILWTEVSAQELRDPFVFGPRQGASSAETPTTSYPGAILIGVLWDPQAPLAMVGDQMVAVGEFLGTWEVVRIQEDGIILQRGDERKFISPGSSIPAQ